MPVLCAQIRDILHERMFLYGHYWMLEDLVSSAGFPQNNNVKRDSTRRSPQSLQSLAGVDSTFPDSSRARLSLQFVCWRRGSSPFGSSRLPLRLLPNGFYCHHLSTEVPRTPSAHLTRGLVLSCHVRCRVEVAPRQSPRRP